MNDVATVKEIVAISGWEASLALTFASHAGRTVLERRAHRGPLVVQKALYPEGEAVCQSIIVHPPAGIAGGDRLQLDVRVDEGARAQLITPGAAKWYRSAGAIAQQQLDFSVGRGASLEWLPQESIVFNGAIADLRTGISLEGDAVFLGWDIVCLGRRLAGEHWTLGRLKQEIVLRRDGARTWMERAALGGASKLLGAGVGLDGATVYGTFLASAMRLSDDLIGACRAIECDEGVGCVSRLPGLMLARYRGDSAEAARSYLAAIWACARRALIGREAVRPRIWNT